MSDDLERVKQDINKARQRQRITNAYIRIFKSRDGQLVLRDLNRFFATNEPAFKHIGMAIQDAAIRDGQRSVILRIDAQLSRSVVSDDDIEEKPKTKIKK